MRAVSRNTGCRKSISLSTLSILTDTASFQRPTIRSRTVLPPTKKSSPAKTAKTRTAERMRLRITGERDAPTAQTARPTTRKTTPAREVEKKSRAAKDGAPHSAAKAAAPLSPRARRHCISPKESTDPTTRSVAVWLRLGSNPKTAPPWNGYFHPVCRAKMDNEA